MIISKSEKYIAKREGSAPEVSPKMVKAVSQYRRDTLEGELNDGKFSGHGSPKDSGFTVHAVGTYKKLEKSAGVGVSGSDGGWRGSGGTTKQSPEVYSPLWLNSNLNLPRDRATINAWCRSFFALNPIVHNAILLHSTYPISKMNIRCKNPKINAFFEDMIDELNLMDVCVQIAQEYWLLGEAFPYAELDEASAKWSRILIQNPDYMVVKRSVVGGEPIISLRPDENLRRIAVSNRPSDIAQREQLDPNIVNHIRRGDNIPLSNFYVSHLARKISPYEVRGTGLPVSCFRQLMLFDKLRESKFAQADNMINPLTIFTVGGGNDAYKPTPEALEQWKDLIETAQYDKDFKIITHDGFKVDVVGKGSSIYDIGNDISQLLKEIYIGLLIPQVIFESGDITYANGGAQLDVLRQRYMQFRNMLSSWLRRKIFAKISEINDFYERIDGQKQLIVPTVEWNHMSLFDDSQYVSALSGLVQQQPAKVSVSTLYRSLGLDYEDEDVKIRKEAIDNVIRAKELESLQKMTLNDLRSIEDGDEIKEVMDGPLPGEDALPGQSSGSGGMGDLGSGLGGGLGGGIGGGLPPTPPPAPSSSGELG